MRNMVKNMVGKVGRSEKGFTLIEMLVVVGIIVALAAVIVPTVIKFAGSGEEGAKDAEYDAVQAAIDIMMTDNSLKPGDIEENLTTAAKIVGATTDFDASSATQLIGSYFRDPATTYCYKWDDTGQLTEQIDCP